MSSFSVTDIAADKAVAAINFELSKTPSQSLVDMPTKTRETLNNSWKQVVYTGYWIQTYQNFVDYINAAAKAGVTHIILEFILFGASYQGSPINWSTIQVSDAVLAWQSFTSTQQIALVDLCNQNHIILMISFGGASSFGDIAGSQYIGFQYTWLNPNSKYSLNNFSNLQASAEALANDLASMVKSLNITSVDLDIESIPTISAYTGSYTDISNYLGWLSQYLKQNGITTVSHAPQTPYFDPLTGGEWGNLYYTVDGTFGQYIDFYNIQYYNNGSYDTEPEFFTNDTSFNASVNQLITANGGTGASGILPIAPNKIVLGQAIDTGAWPNLGNPDNWGPNSNSPNTLYDFVLAQKTSSTPSLANWYNVGGVMAWLYQLQLPVSTQSNQDILNYFTNLFKNHQ